MIMPMTEPKTGMKRRAGTPSAGAPLKTLPATGAGSLAARRIRIGDAVATGPMPSRPETPRPPLSRPSAALPASMDGMETATIPAQAIVALFQRVDLALYGDARRDFLARAGLDPRPSADQAFAEWFAYDCRLDAQGRTPFDITARYLREVTGRIGERQYRDLREVAATNRASWFRVIEADASNGRLWLDDRAGGGVTAVRDPGLAHWFDGTRRGTFVGRIAESRGIWHVVGRPLRVSRREHDDRASLGWNALLKERRPGYADLVRLLYGHDRPCSGRPGGARPVDREALDAYERTHGVEALWGRLLASAEAGAR